MKSIKGGHAAAQHSVPRRPERFSYGIKWFAAFVLPTLFCTVMLLITTTAKLIG